jgi:hypothetical protein
MPTYYLGLDVHKVRTQYCLMDPAGEILREVGAFAIGEGGVLHRLHTLCQTER